MIIQLPLRLIAGMFLLFVGCSPKIKDSTKPNILFIMSDDHAYQAISAYHDSLLQTPNIDRLAKEGIRFTNTSVTNSICAPSRATILTGKHTHLHGKVDNRFPFDTTQTTFPQLFKKAGYKTAMFGKLHFGNSPKGVDEFKILPGQGHYINPDFITTEQDTVRIEGYATDIITDLTLDWLEREAQDDTPFMLMYLHKAPHRPWWPRADKFAEFTQKTFPEPATLFDDYKGRGSAAKTAEMNLLKHMMYSHDSKIRPELITAMGDQVQPSVKEFENGFYGPYHRATLEQRALYKPTLDRINAEFETQWPKMTDQQKMRWKYQRYMQDYLATISSIDDNLGRVLNYLDQSGLSENTIVIYTSDQGFYLGEHGWFDKRFIYDESFKTPLIIRWPRKIQGEQIVTEMVQNLDYAPTLLNLAQIEIPKDMQGKSLKPLLFSEEEETQKWNRDAVYYHYYEYPAVHMVKRHYGLVSEDYKLAHFYYDVDEWELYDRKEDPQEINNVISDPAYTEVVIELKEKLAEMRLEYKDSPELDQYYIDLYRQNGYLTN